MCLLVSLSFCWRWLHALKDCCLKRSNYLQYTGVNFNLKSFYPNWKNQNEISLSFLTVIGHWWVFGGIRRTCKQWQCKVTTSNENKVKLRLSRRFLGFCKPFGFSLNVFTEFAEFSNKNICHYSKRAQTCHLLCKRPGCCHNSSKTRMRDRILVISPIHASMIYQISWIHCITVPFRENSIVLSF